MTKEIEKKTCHFCESNYKLIFDVEETTGQPRCCPFCGEDCYDDDEINLEEEDSD